MAGLGAAQTDKFFIGTAELRVGPLSSAMALIQSHSVGLIDQATYTVNQESVDLEGGFPKKINATAIVRQTATITATMREYSRRNLRIMLGDGIDGASPAGIASTLITTADLVVNSPVVNVDTGDGSLFTADQVIIVYPEGRPSEVSVVQIESISVDALTLKTGQTTAVAYPALTESGTVFHVYVAHQVAIGALTKTNYFSTMLIQQDNSTGQPNVVNFWKCAVGSSMEVATNADDFASSEMELKCLEPAASEYGAGQPLEHVAHLIPTHPQAFLAMGAD